MGLLKDMIKKHEGYRSRIYLDAGGVPTGGWGHAFHKNSRLPEEIWEQILDFDLMLVRWELDKFLDEHNLHHLSDNRKIVLSNMLFNLGRPRLNGFKKFIKALQEQDWRTAVIEMMDSKWAKQVGKRAKDLAYIIRYDEIWM